MDKNCAKAKKKYSKNREWREKNFHRIYTYE